MKQSALVRRFLYLDKRNPELGLRLMLGTAEGKLGPKETTRVFNRSLSATCCLPDCNGETIATRACRPVCYAWAKLRAYNGALRVQAERNDKIVLLDEFPGLMIAAIRYHGVKALRIHSTGEFDSENYIRCWTEIVAACSDVVFWSYTRCYRRGHLIPALATLAALPNSNVLLSCDWDTGLPPAIPDTKRAYLQTREDDRPVYPVDVVFRSSQERAPAVTPAGKSCLVCPHENGRSGTAPACVDCQFCWFKTRTPQKEVAA